MAHPDDRQLQMFADGELGPRKAREVERHAASCPACAAAVEGVRGLGGLVGSALEAASSEARLDRLADSVLEAVRRGRPVPWAERAKVWLGEVGRHRKRVWVPSLAGASAAVAAMVLVLSLHHGPGPTDLPVGSNVLSVSFGASIHGSLFQLEGKDGTTTAVIWVDEGASDPEVKQT